MHTFHFKSVGIDHYLNGSTKGVVDFLSEEGSAHPINFFNRPHGIGLLSRLFIPFLFIADLPLVNKMVYTHCMMCECMDVSALRIGVKLFSQVGPC